MRSCLYPRGYDTPLSHDCPKPVRFFFAGKLAPFLLALNLCLLRLRTNWGDFQGDRDVRRLLGHGIVVSGIVAFHGQTEAADCEGVVGAGVPGAFGVESKAQISAGNHGRSVAADLNGDGLLDLVVPTDEGAFHYPQGRILVFLNQGDGDWRDPTSYAVGARSTVAVVADFSGDGNLDIVANGRPGLVVLVNEGDGTFAPPSYQAEDVFPWDLGSGDFDSDGTPDLVAHHYQSGNHFRFYLTRADAAFEVASDVPLETHSYALAMADYNGDGLADVASVVHLRDNLYLLLSQGDGLFSLETIPAGPLPIHVAAADVDGDGAVDLAVSKPGPEEPSSLNTNTRGGYVSILRNLGAGEFTLPQDSPTTQIKNSPAMRYIPHWITAGDLDGDGDSDLVTANAFTRNVVALVNEDGFFPNAESFNVGFGPWFASLADLDGDRDLDVIAVKDTSIDGRVAVLWNSSISEGSKVCEIEPFRRGDCDGDGFVGGTVNDALAVLNFNFHGAVEPPCLAACDADADGFVRGTVTDAVVLLHFSFIAGGTLPRPFLECGTGTARDEALGCRQAPVGCR